MQRSVIVINFSVKETKNTKLIKNFKDFISDFKMTVKGDKWSILSTRVCVDLKEQFPPHPRSIHSTCICLGRKAQSWTPACIGVGEDL